jgi:hypothetical protein
MSQYGNVFQKEHFTTQRYMAFAARAVYLKGWDAAERPKGCVAKTIVVDAAAAQEVWILSDKTSLSTSAICPRLLFTAFREDPNPIIACVPKSVLFGQAVFLIVGKPKETSCMIHFVKGFGQFAPARFWTGAQTSLAPQGNGSLSNWTVVLDGRVCFESCRRCVVS